ncbi:bifunctional diguanylate cyclase/phosphodiesterase [Xanthomonas graminis]|jgi:PAS domain S-box-containing protein|uniref:Diguanylate cyclase n=1 Tax=Xanthomonas graminis pv. graminis TaxID=134874 RepID=A0A1M4I9Q8_9XANT|nr:EAL domain-containing protein [Xanthomonas translucens]EKU25721.1 two component system sensor-response regulator hybrid protein [Xanthomonas translucens pv. graminis ART-Xtg29]OAX63352.1 two component system sensor-response regulator hybrid protein [Xanthomonas translucens pv. graminis]UKE54698.1 EAL domain-containing protein [Xanthomonas translucens pv. graminis]WIH08589.1 EAL domain-containing protein [Xanthomonas translucens pv. graminis]WIH11920.1 EAL domain-containing protein [Xanthomo
MQRRSATADKLYDVRFRQRLRRALRAPLRAILVWGLALALLLACGLAYVLVQDRGNRLAAVQRQSLALATGADRLLQLELDNLSQALRGEGVGAQTLLADAPARAPALIEASLRGLLRRHPELHDVVLLDAHGQRRFGGPGDPTLREWALGSRRNGEDVFVGPCRRLADGQALVTLALPLASGDWVVAHWRVAALQRIVGGVDAGRDGVVALTDTHGLLLAASSATAGTTGTRIRLPLGLVRGRPQGSAMGMHHAVFDQQPRMLAISGGRNYPLLAVSGLAVREALAPWWWFAGAAALVYLLYLLGFAFLLGSLRRAENRQRRLMDRLRRGDEDLRLAHAMGGIGTWRVEADRGHLLLAEQTGTLFGAPQLRVPLSAFLARVHDDDRARVQQLYDEALHGNGEYNVVYRMHTLDGGLRWLAARGARVQGRDGLCMTGAVQDVSQRIEAQARLFDAERQFRLVFERNPLPFWLFAVDSLRFLEVNQAAIRQYGYSRAEFLGMTLLDLHPPSEAERLLADGREPRDGFDAPRVWTHRRKDGSVLSVRIHSADVDFGGVPVRLILAEDVSQRIAHERELAFRASHDVTTGLLDPRALAEALDARGQAGYAVAYVQVRGLALIGDTLGRAAGDAVRCAVAQRLRGLGERFGLTAHQPSQDFVLAVLDAQQLPQALQALLEAVSAPVQGGAFTQQLQAHVGVALCPDDAAGAEETIGSAAQAAHAAQAEGRSVARFERSMSARIGERLRLAGRIHQAIARQEFELHFQPIMHAGSGAPCLLEALIRWPQADGSYIAPDQFIQLCEDTGLILPLGRWVMQAAAQARRQLALHGWADLPVAVNVSALQFFDGDLVADLGQACAAAGLDADALHLELTESSLMRQPQQALEVLRQLRALGVSVALDDVGTGFSSMAYLRDLPLDTLKIDRSFISDLHRDARNASICEALLTLGRSLGLDVVAEGVETEEQLQWLRAHGCDQVQGYLLGRPAPLAQVIDALGTRNAVTA